MRFCAINLCPQHHDAAVPLDYKTVQSALKTVHPALNNCALSTKNFAFGTKKLCIQHKQKNCVLSTKKTGFQHHETSLCGDTVEDVAAKLLSSDAVKQLSSPA